MRVIDGGGLPVHRLENCPNKRVPRGKRAVGSTEDHKYKSCVPITIILEQISSLVLMVFGTYGTAMSGAAPLHCKHYFSRGRTGFLADIIIAIAPSARLIPMSV